MKRNIEFYIPKSQTIPTRLLLKVDGKQVNYEPAEDVFGYNFEFISGETLEEALDIAKDIASIMCSQSYDHDACWRVVSIEPYKDPMIDPRYDVASQRVQVKFRWKDSW